MEYVFSFATLKNKYLVLIERKKDTGRGVETERKRQRDNRETNAERHVQADKEKDTDIQKSRHREIERL